MTFDYVTVPEGINVDADIYPRRVGREDERVLYGIDPAFIVEACMERRSALGYSKVDKYVLGRAIQRKLPGTSGGGIDFLQCVAQTTPPSVLNWIQSNNWLNRDFKFTSKSGISKSDNGYFNLEDIYPGSAVTNWPSPVEQYNRIIRLDDLKACYHDLARMSRVFIRGKIKHSACTRVMSGKKMFGEFSEDVNEKTQLQAGDGFVTSYITHDISHNGIAVAQGLYCKASTASEEYDFSYHGTVIADPVYSFEGVDKYKAVTALFLLETSESDGETNKYYYDIVAEPVGEDGNVSFDNETAKSICLGHSSLQQLDGLQYVLSILCLDVGLVVDLNLKTDISDIKWE